MKLALVFLLLALEPVAPKRIILPARSEAWVCADYDAGPLERKPNRSCVPASQVRGWILDGGRNVDCGE